MFDLGFSESMMVLVVLILFVKPEDLPKLMNTLGRWYGQVRRMYYSVMDELQSLSEIETKENGES